MYIVVPRPWFIKKDFLKSLGLRISEQKVKTAMLPPYAKTMLVRAPMTSIKFGFSGNARQTIGSSFLMSTDGS